MTNDDQRPLADAYHYVGRELDLAADAVVWKRYWTSHCRPYFGKRVLEAGAGLGANISHLCSDEQEHWLALEPDPGLARRIELQKLSGALPSILDTRVGTLTDLRDDERFDTIFYADVLEHIADDRTEVELAASHLAPGGFLVVLAPAHQALFSALDVAVGHYRRYDRESLLSIKPHGLTLERCIYLDSVGMLASLANRYITVSDMPTPAQLKFWDRFMVRISRVLDPATGYRLGKSILVVWRNDPRTAAD